jgi:fermentation-respiration switch protein FrsA (DUF1100 family)
MNTMHVSLAWRCHYQVNMPHAIHLFSHMASPVGTQIISTHSSMGMKLLDPDAKGKGTSRLARMLIRAATSAMCILLLGVLLVLGWQRAFIYPSWLQTKELRVMTPLQAMWKSEPAPKEDLYASKFCWEDVWLTAADGVKVNAFWIKAVSDCTLHNPDLQSSLSMLKSAAPYSIPTIIFFHGTKGNVRHRLEVAAALQKQLACNIMMLQYRGYGRSKGSSHEAGIKMDADAAIKWTVQRVTELNSRATKASQRPLYSPELVVYGQSLGGAVAIYAASSAPEHIKTVVVENTFLSIPKVIRDQTPLLWPFTFLIYEVWASETLMPLLTQRVLVLVSSKDEIVPSHHSKALFELAARARKLKMVTVPDAGHTTATLHTLYFSTVTNFINE